VGVEFEGVHDGEGQILVVEDDEILRDVIPHILNRLGYSFIMADTPEEAMYIGAQQEIEIDVLLTDVVMPGMSGKELWEQFRILRPHTKVIYMSGYTADVISRQGVRASEVRLYGESGVSLGRVAARRKPAATVPPATQ
jgi:two-component system cell cycle sensor histidine kinase/response regulator CckA